MMTLGITGRSGCGKSTVTEYFRAQGIPCADADQIARQVLEPGSPCLAPLADAFGRDILLPSGMPDRRLLADRAFATPEGTALLTRITHPEIIRRIIRHKTQAEASGSWLFLVDAAVIVGTAFEHECDKLLVITAPPEESIRRICARDGITPEMAARRLHAQMSESILMEKADFVISNDSDRDALLQKAAELLEKLRKDAHA